MLVIVDPQVMEMPNPTLTLIIDDEGLIGMKNGDMFRSGIGKGRMM
jgi:hypothetical protein